MKLCSWVDALTQITMNITTALASALHYTILLFWLAVFSLNYVSSIQCLETFNMAGQLQELLRKTLKAFIQISWVQWNFSEYFTQKQVWFQSKKATISWKYLSPDLKHLIQLCWGEPAKTSVEDLGAAAKSRDINKNDCQEQHGEIFYPGEKAPALHWSDTSVQKTT